MNPRWSWLLSSLAVSDEGGVYMKHTRWFCIVLAALMALSLAACGKDKPESPETKTVTLKLKGSDLAFVGYDKKWRLEKGRFRMKCGSEVLYINCEKDKIWNTPNIN